MGQRYKVSTIRQYYESQIKKKKCKIYESRWLDRLSY
jgi:hypothetical protein